MTTIEHALLGINGALATGLHRRYGWQVVALAGLVAISPDWDGLTLVLGPVLFDQAHRVWGHSLLTCGLLGILIGVFDYRFDIVTRLANVSARGLRRCGLELPAEQGLGALPLRRERTVAGYAVWTLVAIAAALSHLAADLVVSGTATLGDWKLQLLWPFSTEGWIYPHVHWGDPGMTIIFVMGMLAMYRWRNRLQLIAAATLLGVAAYIIVCGALG